MSTALSPTGRRADRVRERLFVALSAVSVAVPLLVLALLLGDVLRTGLGRVDWAFLTSYPSRHWERAGILPALVGTLLLNATAAAMTLPVGVAAAIWLEEYAEAAAGRGGRARRTAMGWLARLVEVNIANLAGVPSILYGLLGLGLFVRTLGMGRSLLAGACTLALLVLPVVVLASREALRTVPDSLREAAWALGATRWQLVRRVVLPLALPGILTGTILAVSRAVGETAPLVVIGALVYLTFLPTSLSSPFSALPIQIYNWTSRPQAGFQTNAAGAIVVLLATLLLLNAAAILVRARLQRRSRA
ncbi:MAG: phosphate ABC transporter permease PstA [Deltaproteobacteria bacterium]|nr:phosphate ABC transporter permease PstA [Deltaproteobacteria bacterium]